MQTDIPLKVLTAARPADLLPLIGTPDATVLGVESLELPTTATRLDTLLHLRSPLGTVYYHLLEWQGYSDPKFLWRSLSYVAWLGLHGDERPVAATLVYLHPEDDIGDALRQVLDGRELWMIPFHCVRLWEQDAEAAVASGRLGLAVLSPLMGGATRALVERAADLVLAHAGTSTQQADLLTILGIFAEPLIEPARFLRMIGRERMMASDLLSYLMEEKTAELEREHAATLERERAELERERAELEREHAATLERERADLETQLRQALIQAVEDAMAARFPAAPFALVSTIQQVRAPERLQELLRAVLRAPDQASAVHALHEAAGDRG